MTYISKNIPRPTKAGAGAREQIKNLIYVIPLDAIQTTPSRDSQGVKIVGNYVLKPGKYVEGIYATSSTIKLSKTSDGDEDAMGFTHGVEFGHPGDEVEINEFIQNRNNVPCIIAVGIGNCSNPSHYKIYGGCDNPLTVSVETTNDNEKTMQLMKFDAKVKTKNVPGFYFGTFPTDTVKTIPADTTTPDVALGNGNYEIAPNTAVTEIIDLQNGTHDQVVTLVGKSDTNSSTINQGGSFQLKEGAMFTLTQDESITLRAFQNDTVGIIWIEQSRQ